MIRLTFYFGTELINATICNSNVYFSANGMVSTLDGLNYNHAGVIQEFPDLKGNPNWKQEAVNRLKTHLASLKSEDEISDYVIKELRSKGYIPKIKQKQGFRAEVIQ